MMSRKYSCCCLFHYMHTRMREQDISDRGVTKYSLIHLLSLTSRRHLAADCRSKRMNGQHMNATVNILEAENTGLGASEILRELVLYNVCCNCCRSCPLPPRPLNLD